METEYYEREVRAEGSGLSVGGRLDPGEVRGADDKGVLVGLQGTRSSGVTDPGSPAGGGASSRFQYGWIPALR